MYITVYIQIQRQTQDIKHFDLCVHKFQHHVYIKIRNLRNHYEIFLPLIFVFGGSGRENIFATLLPKLF